jgi:hypothetical protein
MFATPQIAGIASRTFIISLYHLLEPLRST